MLNQISKYLNVKLALVILLFNLTSQIGTSQGLKFQLKDEEDGSGLNAAKIIVFQDGNTVLSDNSGYFELSTNYLGQEIKISHASYNTKRMILRIDSDTVQIMTRKYRPLGTVYLEKEIDPSFNGWPIIKGAKFKTGWGPFVYNLQVALKEKSVTLDSLKEVQFEVSSSGEMALSQPASDSFEIALSQVFDELNNWEPGEYNGTKVRQFFKLKFLNEEPEFQQIFTIVEERPYPEGGMDGLVKKHLSRIVYPQEALDLGIEGQVFVQFIINEDGSLSDVKAIKGIGHGCDEEAIRVIKESSPWTPGRQRGRPVKVRMIIPISFKDIKKTSNNEVGNEG